MENIAEVVVITSSPQSSTVEEVVAVPNEIVDGLLGKAESTIAKIHDWPHLTSLSDDAFNNVIVQFAREHHSNLLNEPNNEKELKINKV